MHDDIKKETHFSKVYKVFENGYYNMNASDEIIRILHKLWLDETRVRFHWGDTATGKDWGDEYGVRGTIGRSMGPVHIPLLIHNRRSHGGGAILTDAIVKITATKGGRVIYCHPKYHTEKKECLV